MALTYISSKGRAFKMALEASLGSYTEGDFEGANGGGAVYVDGDLNFPTSVAIAGENPNTTHAMWSSQADLPVVYKSFKADAFTLPYRLRPQLGTNGTEYPPIVKFFESAGCNLSPDPGVDETAASGTTDVLIKVGGSDIAAKGTGILSGMGTANADGYWPSIVCSEAVSQSYVPWMALPADVVADGNDVCPMHTVYPTTNEVAAGKSLAFRLQNRGQHTTAPDLAFTASGCVLSKVAPFKITPMGIPQMDFTFHTCDVNPSPEGGANWKDGTHIDDARFAPPFGSAGGTYRARCGMATHVKTGAIAATAVEFIEAEVDLGLNTIVVSGSGTNDSLYGAHTFISAPTVPKVTLTWRMKHDFFKMWEDEIATKGSLTSYYLEFAMPTADPLQSPAWILALPKVRLMAPPEADFQGAEYLKCKAVFLATGSDDTALPSATGYAVDSAPWIFAISHKYVAT